MELAALIKSIRVVVLLLAVAASVQAQRVVIRMQPLEAAPLPKLPVLHGVLVNVDSEPVSGASVVVGWGGIADTIASDSSGRFAMMERPVVGDTVTVTILPGAALHPARVLIPGDRIRDETDVVLLPSRWAIRGGAFAGETVSISPAAALRRSERESFSRMARARYGTRRDIVAWPRERLPIPLAIHRDEGQRITDADSVALWQTVAALEDELGMALFKPAGDSAVQADGWGTSVRVDPTLNASGLTFDTWEGGGQLFDAAITVRHASDFSDRTIMFHELLHALGFGHTSAWTSIMAKHVSSATQALTEEDVAYTQVLLRLGQVQRALRTSYGLREAMDR